MIVKEPSRGSKQAFVVSQRHIHDLVFGDLAKPIVAFTLGDPAGEGPSIIAQVQNACSCPGNDLMYCPRPGWTGCSMPFAAPWSSVMLTLFSRL